MEHLRKIIKDPLSIVQPHTRASEGRNTSPEPYRLSQRLLNESPKPQKIPDIEANKWL